MKLKDTERLLNSHTELVGYLKVLVAIDPTSETFAKMARKASAALDDAVAVRKAIGRPIP